MREEGLRLHRAQFAWMQPPLLPHRSFGRRGESDATLSHRMGEGLGVRDLGEATNV